MVRNQTQQVQIYAAPSVRDPSQNLFYVHPNENSIAKLVNPLFTIVLTFVYNSDRELRGSTLQRSKVVGKNRRIEVLYYIKIIFIFFY